MQPPILFVAWLIESMGRLILSLTLMLRMQPLQLSPLHCGLRWARFVVASMPSRFGWIGMQRGLPRQRVPLERGGRRTP